MNDYPKENIYGHIKRLSWIKKFISKDDLIVEFGCGTGYMITYPLLKDGYNIIGVDLDTKSIEYGQAFFSESGLEGNSLKEVNIRDLNIELDVIIASEVFEHIPFPDLKEILETIGDKLKPGGRLLVTVPNGYGWFELESLLWFKCKIGSILQYLQVTRIISIIKRFLLGPDIVAPCPSTLSDSPHVQHFTYTSIKALLRRHGFEVIDSTGSVLFAGPFSNLLFTGIKPIMMLNCMLGGVCPVIAAGFYIACRLPK
jgi:SAM-dependent methyltransferase